MHVREHVKAHVLEPQRGHKLDPISFSASLKRIHGRWLVDSFYPAATFISSQHRVIGPRDFAAPSMQSAAGNSRLGAVWILVLDAFWAMAWLLGRAR